MKTRNKGYTVQYSNDGHNYKDVPMDEYMENGWASCAEKEEITGNNYTWIKYDFTTPQKITKYTDPSNDKLYELDETLVVKSITFNINEQVKELEDTIRMLKAKIRKQGKRK